MTAPTPSMVLTAHSAKSPEELATALGLQILRVNEVPSLPGVRLCSEYRPPHDIILYLPPLHALSLERGECSARLEAWHIAHEIFHALAEQAGESCWSTSERAADRWADELLVLLPACASRRAADPHASSKGAGDLEAPSM